MRVNVAPEDGCARAGQRQLIEAARQEARDFKRLEADLAGSVPLPLPDSFPGYEIVRQIHRGGQGVVYEAIQLATNRTVALKVMREGPAASERSKWRFEREVKLVASLKHANVVVIHDSGIVDGKHYFAMDYVRGRPLDMHVRSSNPSMTETLRLLERVCDAVSSAHRRGVIHRDLKPSNILVDQDGVPYVLDFGLAKVIGNELAESRTAFVSLAGNLMGTLPYMSPEQTRGDPDAIDTRTDVYALGVILYELLTGSPPYRTTGLDIRKALENIENADPPHPSKLRAELGSEVDAIVLKAMAKEPDRRYQSAGELGEDLKSWLEGRPVTAKSDSAFYVLRKLAVRHGFETTVVATLLLTLVSFSGISFRYYLHARDALQKQARSDRAALRAEIAKDHFVNDTSAAAQLAVQRLPMGWFLFFWEANRLDEARRIQGHVPKSSPEYAAMSFLLDDDYTVEQFRNNLAADAEALLHFALAERALKEGRFGDAVRCFELSAEFPGGDWLKWSAEARLEQIRADPAAVEREDAVQPHRIGE